VIHVDRCTPTRVKRGQRVRLELGGRSQESIQAPPRSIRPKPSDAGSRPRYRAQHARS
jgi:hypothetical protein